MRKDLMESLHGQSAVERELQDEKLLNAHPKLKEVWDGAHAEVCAEVGGVTDGQGFWPGTARRQAILRFLHGEAQDMRRGTRPQFVYGLTETRFRERLAHAR